MPLGEIIKPHEWWQSAKEAAIWLQQDLGMKAGVIIAVILAYFGICHFIRVLRER